MTKQRRENNPAVTILEPTFTEITIAENGNLQPFLKTFRYAPENASQESLGTMLGVFEIGVQNETSAYIVNFLASVAKKEYFSQPRRSVTESLEATLHKINRALAELIKQGNTEWLGSLHAAIGVIDQGMLHFSVTGNGAVVLLRNGFLSVISEGLAPEEAATHPLKTFIEISSGRLQQQDILFITSPELLEIFTPEDLERAAKRFESDKLAPFIRTALINQSPIGGVFLLSFKEITPVPKTKQVLIEKTPTKKTLPVNVFSQNAFQRPAKAHTTPNILIPQHRQTPPTEYTDDTTGHIYVQGEVPPKIEPHQERLEQLSVFLRTHLRWFHYQKLALGLFLRRIRSNSSYSILFFLQSAWRSFRQSIHALFFAMYRRRMDKIERQTTMNTALTQSYHSFSTSETLETSNNVNAPEKQISFFNRIIQISSLTISTVWQSAVKVISTIYTFVVSHWSTLPTKHRRVVSLILLVGCFLIGSLLWKYTTTPDQPETPKTSAVETPPTPNETNQTSITSDLLWQHSNIQMMHIWKENSILALGSNEVSILNTTTNENTSYVLPEENGSILQSAFLPDIQTLIVLTNSGLVYSFTPANHTWNTTNLRFDNPKEITAFAGYSTYLYIFDASKKSILRYPRSEGGFGSPVSWFREDTSFSAVNSLSVGTDILIPTDKQLFIYTRGKQNTSVSFENSTTPITFSQATFDPSTNSFFALDTHFGRVIEFSADGKIRHQYIESTLKQATSFVFESNTRKIFFTSSEGVHDFAIQQ